MEKKKELGVLKIIHWQGLNLILSLRRVESR